MFEFFIENPPHRTVTDFVSEALKSDFKPPYLAMGFITEGKLSGGVVFHNWTGEDVELSIVAPGLINRRFIRMLCTVAFQDNGCARATCFTRPSNKIAQTTLERIGFKFEGTRRNYYGDDDGLMYGLLKEECSRWLE